ncbi:MAG: exonuclease, partial [Candidatus Binatia bacterium]|nr:exonuclease [Candidatus Binatia bacterium]
MLRHTFQHVQGIGEKTERRLWRAGVTDWLSFLEAPHSAPLPQRQRDAICAELEHSLRALERRDARYFTARLAPQHRWRLYPEFGQRVAYLDIETTSGNADTASITVIGLSDGARLRVYVTGENLACFAAEI